MGCEGARSGTTGRTATELRDVGVELALEGAAELQVLCLVRAEWVGHVEKSLRGREVVRESHSLSRRR